MNSEPLSLSRPARGTGSRLRISWDAAAHARLALAPQGLQFDPAGGDVDGAEGEEEEAPGSAATMGDQIDLEEAGATVVPLGEGANGDLLLEPGAGPRGRDPAQPVAGARGRQERLRLRLVERRRSENPGGEAPWGDRAAEPRVRFESQRRAMRKMIWRGVEPSPVHYTSGSASGSKKVSSPHARVSQFFPSTPPEATQTRPTRPRRRAVKSRR